MATELLSKIIFLSISPALYDRLKARKKDTGCFVSEFCRRAIKARLDLEDKEKQHQNISEEK